MLAAAGGRAQDVRRGPRSGVVVISLVFSREPFRSMFAPHHRSRRRPTRRVWPSKLVSPGRAASGCSSRDPKAILVADLAREHDPLI